MEEEAPSPAPEASTGKAGGKGVKKKLENVCFLSDSPAEDQTTDGSGDQVGKTGHDFPEILFLEIIGQFKKFLRISTALTERNLSTNFFLILSIFSKFRF